MTEQQAPEDTQQTPKTQPPAGMPDRAQINFGLTPIKVDFQVTPDQRAIILESNTYDAVRGIKVRVEMTCLNPEHAAGLYRAFNGGMFEGGLRLTGPLLPKIPQPPQPTAPAEEVAAPEETQEESGESDASA